MTIALASSTMQAMAVAFMASCLVLRLFKILDTVGVLVSMAMGSVLLACSGILLHDTYLAAGMFTIHVVCALLVIAVTRRPPLHIRQRRHS